jgi:pseudaminic acid synthase
MTMESEDVSFDAFDVAGIRIGAGLPPFVIAELSGNHNGSLDRALALVDAIAGTGVQAIKLQTYTADTMTLDIAESEFRITDPDSLWSGESLYTLYERAHTPWEWHEPIFKRARAAGMIAFSTPFDASAVDYLERLDVPAYKIASFEITDVHLIARAAATGKPLILSTGLATLDEIAVAVAAARSAGCRQLALLKCSSSYPASAAESNLSTIPVLRARFGCEVGLSDHTLGIGVAVGAVALGATIIEKHVTLRRADGGVDSAFSLEPEELAALVQATRDAAEAIGTPSFGPTPSEEGSLIFRRSLYITRDLRAGDVITHADVRAIRPGYGLSPAHLTELIGRQVAADVKRGTPASWDLLRPNDVT